MTKILKMENRWKEAYQDKIGGVIMLKEEPGTRKSTSKKQGLLKAFLSILRYFTMMTNLNAKGSSCTFLSFLAA